MAVAAGALAGGLSGGAHDLLGVGQGAAGVAEGAGTAIAGIANGAGRAFEGIGHALGQAGAARDGTLKFSRKERDRVDRKTGHVVPGRSSSVEVNPANLAVGAVGLAVAAGIFCMVKHGPINTFLYGCEGSARRERESAPPGPPGLLERIFSPPEQPPTSLTLPAAAPQTVITVAPTALGGAASGYGGAASADPRSYGYGGSAQADPRSYGYGGAGGIASGYGGSASALSDPLAGGPLRAPTPRPAEVPVPVPVPDGIPVAVPDRRREEVPVAAASGLSRDQEALARSYGYDPGALSAEQRRAVVTLSEGGTWYGALPAPTPAAASPLAASRPQLSARQRDALLNDPLGTDYAAQAGALAAGLVPRPGAGLASLLREAGGLGERVGSAAGADVSVGLPVLVPLGLQAWLGEPGREAAAAWLKAIGAPQVPSYVS